MMDMSAHLNIEHYLHLLKLHNIILIRLGASVGSMQVLIYCQQKYCKCTDGSRCVCDYIPSKR